jgi:hypothetical protein
MMAFWNFKGVVAENRCGERRWYLGPRSGSPDRQYIFVRNETLCFEQRPQPSYTSEPRRSRQAASPLCGRPGAVEQFDREVPRAVAYDLQIRRVGHPSAFDSLQYSAIQPRGKGFAVARGADNSAPPPICFASCSRRTFERAGPHQRVGLRLLRSHVGSFDQSHRTGWRPSHYRKASCSRSTSCSFL